MISSDINSFLQFGIPDILFLPILLLIYILSIEWFRRKIRNCSRIKLYSIAIFHLIFSIIFLAYNAFAGADAFGYYLSSINIESGWSGVYLKYGKIYGTSFIVFLVYPFSNILGLSYLSCTLIFAYFGFVGILFLFRTILENILDKKRRAFIDPYFVLILLPGLHFWTVSVGKDSIVFLGTALVFYAQSKLRNRKLPLVFGILIIAFTRLHVCIVLLFSLFVALLFASKEVKAHYKLLLLLIGGITVTGILPFVLETLNLYSFDFEQINANIKQYSGYGKHANSYINMSEKSYASMLFTYLYRPLFFDAPNAFWFIVSFDNLILFLVTIFSILKFRFVKWVFRGRLLVTFSIIYLVFGGLFLASFTNNYGVAVRQKLMVLPGLIILIVLFLDFLHLERRNKLFFPNTKD